MNYREFFKNRKALAKDIQSLIPEGVDQKEFNTGIATEKEHTNDEFIAAKIAGDHLKEDPKYYTKLSAAGLEEEEQDECATCGCGDPSDDHSDDQPPYDDFNDGLPKLGGALAVPHLGDPIRMAKIISVGPLGKGPANGDLSGYSSMGGGKGATGKGVAKDQGGLEVTPDSEPITAGGKKVDGGIATKTVGGSVVPGEGQEQGGKNSVGTIADTAKLDESKAKIREEVKRVLKEIRFNRKTGKWEKINENTVDMKMGPSYKTVQPRLYKTSEDDFARTNQYEPEISEQYDEEEECKMQERYTELVNAPRNLNEDEIAEMGSLREKIEKMQLAKRNYGLSQGGVEPNLYEKKDKWLQGAVNPEHKGYCTPMTKKTCTPRRKAFAMRAKHGGFEEAGLTSEAKVDMKMGPSYKVVQPTLAKTSEPDQFSRTNQYDPEVSESGEPNGDMKLTEEEIQALMKDVVNAAQNPLLSKQGHKDQPGFRLWICKKCGQELSIPSTERRPENIRWTDGHICYFVPAKSGEGVGAQPFGDRTAHGDPATEPIGEAGIGAVQHSSYRTTNHGNLPQDPKTRWSDDLDEVTKKVSKVVKTIQKGQKTKKTKKNPLLKQQPVKKTTSGVHKRKTK